MSAAVSLRRESCDNRTTRLLTTMCNLTTGCSGRRGAPPLNRSVDRPRESVIEKTQCKLREAEFFFTQLSRAAEQVADA